MSEDIMIFPKCDMMINQNRFIGADPIGHCCMNDAVFQTTTHFICDSCANAMANNWVNDKGDKVSTGIGTVIGWKERVQENLKFLTKGNQP